MILVSGHFHYLRSAMLGLQTIQSDMFCGVQEDMETDSGSKTNEIEAQGLDLHLCIICQRKKKNENLVEKPEAHEKVWVSIEGWSNMAIFSTQKCGIS